MKVLPLPQLGRTLEGSRRRRHPNTGGDDCGRDQLAWRAFGFRFASPYFYGLNRELNYVAIALRETINKLGAIGMITERAEQTIQKQSELNRGRREMVPSEVRTGAATRPYPARLLLVEDHAELAEATAEFLSTAGLEVRIAESGKDALQIAITFKPDIILCDMMLPDMLGSEVARAIRRNPAATDALLVMHTAMSDTELRILEREPTMDEFNLFLSKPMTREKIDRLWTGLAAVRRSKQ
jgi:CheY-like chemotaxis protein